MPYCKINKCKGTVTIQTGNGEIYNRYIELRPFLFVKIVHLVDRTYLLKTSNLVYGGREIVTSLYSSLQKQRQTVYGGYSELAGSPFASVKIYDLGNFLEQMTL
jgi:hypothetical protein